MVVASTVARVKRLIPIDAAETSKDTLLADMLAAVSREFERHIGYDFERMARTELHSARPGDEVIFLRVIPVVSIASVKIADDQDFAAATPLVVGSEYRLRGDPSEGLLWIDPSLLQTGVDTVQVVYTAGLGATTNDIISAAPDLAHALDLQTAEEYRRSTSPSTQTRPGPRGPRTFSSQHGMLARVEELLTPYRRILLPESLPSTPI